jgi:hypothetical protein
MVLQAVRQSDGYWYLAGVTATGGPVFLGRQCFPVGPHWVGFDDRFAEPLIVKAYYDPTVDPVALHDHSRRPFEFIGYQQVMRLSFRGISIPPDVFGGRFADRKPYVYDDRFAFLDFMGPKDADLRGITYPFYPLNALLVDDEIRDISDLFVHPRANGSLFSFDDTRSNRSLCASLVAPVAPGLLTAAEITPVLSAENTVLDVPADAAELARKGAYRIAVDLLTGKTPWPYGDPPPWEGEPPLAGLDESLVSGQVIGDYVLLTLPDDAEYMPDTLCVREQEVQGGKRVVVHLLSFYDMEDITGGAGRAVLWRIREFLLDQSIELMDIDGPPPGRGMSGLNATPFYLTPDQVAVEMKYATVAVGYIKQAAPRFRCLYLNGFTWSALLSFNEDTGELVFDRVRRPVPLSAFSLRGMQRRFTLALRLQPSDRIDTSNFTQAAMAREPFAAGRALTFVDDSGQEITE